MALETDDSEQKARFGSTINVAFVAGSLILYLVLDTARQSNKDQ
ncbi:MAG: hypothetical protein JWP89_5443 [Schlesneria sp.]|nr:hypothetical protein [Schlesneria sp.]